jgi:hypothetical protein
MGFHGGAEETAVFVVMEMDLLRAMHCAVVHEVEAFFSMPGKGAGRTGRGLLPASGWLGGGRVSNALLVTP